MTSSSPDPKLPTWLFFLTDLAFLAAAFAVGAYAHRPWTETTIIAIVVLPALGAAVLIFWLLAYYERQKNEMLDDRQRALESISQTVASSAEQISIATGGLHEITELAQKNLKHAEQLPHRLQEKIAEFQAQLANASDTEKEELEKELEELRSTESERLQSVSDKIAKTVAEYAKLEASTQQHLSAANEAVSKLSFGAAGAIGKAQAAAEQAFAQARQEASRTLGESTGAALKSLETARTSALAEIAAQFDAGVARLREATARLDAAAQNLAAATPAADSPGHPSAPSGSETEPLPAALAPVAPEPGAPAPTEAAAPSAAPAETPAPKRPRKPRREDPAAAVGSAPIPAAPGSGAAPPPAAGQPEAAAVAPAPEPAPIPPEKIQEISPVVPATSDPFAHQEPANIPSAEPAKPPRKRAPKKVEDDQPALGLEPEKAATNGESETSSDAASGVVERVLTSDGATRLIVTAYIGIGNRLFIRGNGAGLSWDKGAPLQFVSIGKWRWETNEASGPIQFKLLKNDEQECTGLGTLTIEPGHQHEVTAAFA